MAMYSHRLRRALLTTTSCLNRSITLSSVAPTSVTPSVSTVLQRSVLGRFTEATRAPMRLFSTRQYKLYKEGDEITENTVLFEGCDYNHWLITMDFPKDNPLSPEEMVSTYEKTCAAGLGISLEEAKKKIYACSTTTYQGFQAIMTEEESEKFKDLPGVVFILPDSYIDPANKEYGGDKYENGVITHRPPPFQPNRRQPRDKFNQRPDRQGGPQNFQRNPQYGQQPPMQGGGGGGYGGPQQSYGQAPPPPFQGGYNQGPPRSLPPPYQGGYNQGQGSPVPPYQGPPGGYGQGRLNERLKASGDSERREPETVNRILTCSMLRTDLPGVVFILPDSYIDPANKEYGGDKYENGVITHRPPPFQPNRRQPRDKFNQRPDRQGGPQNFQRNPQYGQQPPMQGGGGGGYGGPQQSYGQAPPPPFQGGYNQGPPRSLPPPYQGGYNQGQGSPVPPYQGPPGGYGQGGPGNFNQGPQGGYNQGGPRNYGPQGGGNYGPAPGAGAPNPGFGQGYGGPGQEQNQTFPQGDQRNVAGDWNNNTPAGQPGPDQ
ncbi:hypothetical protein DY000_02037536, partial [Brassica cretica]